jgi:hypothetical protein
MCTALSISGKAANLVGGTFQTLARGPFDDCRDLREIDFESLREVPEIWNIVIFARNFASTNSVFVMTHHPREPLPMQGGTTFTFATGGSRLDLNEPGRRPVTRTLRSPAARVPAPIAPCRRESRLGVVSFHEAL